MYKCKYCGETSLKWLGFCPACQEMDSMEEVEEEKKAPEVKVGYVSFSEISEAELERIQLPFKALNRVFGGGLVKGSFSLLAGEPGVGKSTILLQVLSSLEGFKCLYISGEESLSQVKLRALRLGVGLEHVAFSSSVSLQAVVKSLEEFDFVVIDSIQTVSSTGSVIGSVSQLREAASEILAVSKKNATTVLAVGHVTKDGTVAGPRVLEHVVDTVIYLETTPDNLYKIARASKNRYGAVNEIGILRMTSSGLEDVNNPSEVFSSKRTSGISGIVPTVILEGSRPLVVEIQALVSKSYVQPQRIALGIENSRLSVLSAILSKKGRFPLHNHDIYVVISGGLRVKEFSSDLATAAAIVSSYLDRAVDPSTVCLGEVSLSGEIRIVPNLEERLREAKRLGYKRALCPKSSTRMEGLEVLGVETLTEAVSLLF